MNDTKQFKDGQHKRMWQRIRAMRKEAAKRGDYLAADFMELLEFVASGERIEKVAASLKSVMAKPAIESINL